MIASAYTSAGVIAGAVVAIILITAGAVAAFLGVNDDTREAIEDAADKRIDDARGQVEQMATIGREWRENYQALEEMRQQERSRHEAQLRDANEHLTKAREELAVANAKTDLSGLEERLNKRLDAFLATQKQQTEVLGSLADTVATIASQLNAIKP